MARPIRIALVTLLLVVHAFGVASVWPEAVESKHGRDFATYYYAVQVADEGGDPYDRVALAKRSRGDRTRKSVYPFLYPPSFLPPMGWVRPLSMGAAYLLWFWLDEAFTLLAALFLTLWWRPLGGNVGVVVVAGIAVCTAIPNNHLMGQVNLPVLALALAGLWQESRGRWHIGGLLLGFAVALKVSPALLIGWWILRGRWRAVFASLAGVLVAVAITVGLYGVEPFVTFAVEVLPTFRSGVYNDLDLTVGLFGNHSLPNVWDQIAPAPGKTLSRTAQIASAVTAVVVLAGLALLWRRAPTDYVAAAAQAAGVMVVMLLLPVFTYEHHVVWALPAVVLSAIALGQRRLGVAWAVPLALAWVAWAVDLSLVRQLYSQSLDVPVIPVVLREAKSVALVILATAMAVLGRGPRHLE